MTLAKFLERFSLNTIEVLFAFSYLILASLMIGLTIFSKNTYKIVQVSLQIILSLFIMYKFNPFSNKTSISSMERRIIFSCAIYLFLATVPYHYISQLYL